MRKLTALLLLLMMTTTTALAELRWPRLTTEGQEQLQAYVERVNENLLGQGQAAVNSIFELYETFAIMGVTGTDGAEVPESVEMTFSLDEAGPVTMQLRVSETGRFAAIAAACVQAASPTAIELSAALADAQQYVQRTLDAPYTAFEDEVNAMQGQSPRVYYAYYPNQYSDGVDWRQVTLVFPLPGSEDAPLAVTPAPMPQATEDADEVYGKNTYGDEYTHLEVFLTPTPEPDSAANEP